MEQPGDVLDKAVTDIAVITEAPRDSVADVVNTVFSFFRTAVGGGAASASVAPPAPSLFAPSTWTLPMWLLVGGVTYFAFSHLGGRHALASNPPRRRRRVSHFGTRRRKNPMGMPAYTSPSVRRHPTRSLHAAGSKVRFHGAFADAGDAAAKAQRLGGWVKSFTVRGQKRHSVVTAV